MLYGTHTIPSEPTITNLREYGNGWMWDVPGEDILSGEEITLHYRTAKRGEGIFEMADDGDEAQLVGLCQFSTSTRRDTARRQIKRFFARVGW